MKSLIIFIRSRNAVPFLILFYTVGLAGMIIPATREFFPGLTPFTILLSVGLLFIYHEKPDTRFWLTAFLVFLLGYFIEVIGVNTGFLFGDYVYGKSLGLKLINTPLIIGLNWLMLVYCTIIISRQYIINRYFRAVASAAAMVVYDFALEPSAVYLDMWRWENNVVPLQNYLGWFIFAFLLGLVADALNLTGEKNKLALPLFFIQLIFFITLDIWVYAEKIWG